MTGTVQVKASIEHGRIDLPLGAAIVGSANLDPRPSIVLPLTTLASADGEPAVWTIGESSRVSPTPVNVVDYIDGNVVLAGDSLPEGVLVVLRGPRSLRDGQAVTVTQEPQL